MAPERIPHRVVRSNLVNFSLDGLHNLKGASCETQGGCVSVRTRVLAGMHGLNRVCLNQHVPASVGRGKAVNLGKGLTEIQGCPSLLPPTDFAALAERDDTVVLTSGPVQLGFLTVLHEASGYLGGYLVTNLWGRPVEFRLSTAVQPNRVQQILYGHTLPGYLHGELIGKTLVEKTSAQAALILTDRPAVLEMRNALDVPVVWVVADELPIDEGGLIVRPATDDSLALVTSRKYENDLPRIRDVLDQLDTNLDLLEPFSRIREAIAEARKLGVTSRA